MKRRGTSADDLEAPRWVWVFDEARDWRHEWPDRDGGWTGEGYARRVRSHRRAVWQEARRRWATERGIPWSLIGPGHDVNHLSLLFDDVPAEASS